MKFCFRAAVAKSLQVAQGVLGNGDFLFNVNVKSKVFVNVKAKNHVALADGDWNRIRKVFI